MSEDKKKRPSEQFKPSAEPNGKVIFVSDDMVAKPKPKDKEKSGPHNELPTIIWSPNTPGS